MFPWGADFWRLIAEKGPWAVVIVLVAAGLFFGGRAFFGWLSDKFFSQIVRMNESATNERKTITERYLSSLEHGNLEFLTAIRESTGAITEQAKILRDQADRMNADHQQLASTQSATNEILGSMNRILEAVSRSVVFLEEWHVKAQVIGGDPPPRKMKRRNARKDTRG